jgi:mRNA interferase MazF
VHRGDVYDARLDPAEGSEQGGSRPVVIVSQDIINASSPVVMVVPCTTYRPGRRIYPSQTVVYAPDGGLTVDSVLLGEQIRVLDKRRLLRRRGSLSESSLERISG